MRSLRPSAVSMLAAVVIGSGFAVSGLVRTAALAVTPPLSAPTTPPAAICGNTSLLSGPTVAPPGAVTVAAGDNSAVNWNQPGATFWFAPGTHTLGSSEFAQVIPGADTTFVGAPGAILDGQSLNRYAFTQQASGVTIKYLTIQNFVAPQNESVVNQGAAPNWTIQYNTVRNNDAAGVFVGTNNVVSDNCLDANGQYGFSMYKPQVAGASSITNITIDHNEISNNNTDDWESKIPGCGCTGGGKFWDVQGAMVTNNWVHHNKSVGLWADTNNIDFVFSGNYVNDNTDEGIFYEISYNAVIRNNTLKRNAIVKGQSFAARGDNFPVAAIYLSEAGGDARLASAKTGTAVLDVSGNYLEDNWGGVALWENANRFCNSPSNTSTTYCTKGGAATMTTCVPGTVGAQPYYSDCRWKTQNVSVTNNEFHMNPAAVANCNTAFCGHTGLLSQWGTYPDWSPYQRTVIQEAITFNQNNHWANNTYFGPWQFMPYDTSRLGSFATWQAGPYSQDSGSTLNGTGATSTTIPPITIPPITIPPITIPPIIIPPITIPPIRTLNALDSDTASIEGGPGHWAPWYSTTVARSTRQAHSGVASARVAVTAPYGWGVALDNWPGFVSTSGTRTLGFSARAGSGSTPVTMTVTWRNITGTTLQMDSINLPSVTTAWQDVSATVTAPPGTTAVDVSLAGSSPAGVDFYVDDVQVG